MITKKDIEAVIEKYKSPNMIKSQIYESELAGVRSWEVVVTFKGKTGDPKTIECIIKENEKLNHFVNKVKSELKYYED